MLSANFYENPTMVSAVPSNTLSHDQIISRIQFFRDWMLKCLDDINSDLAICEYANDDDKHKGEITFIKLTIEGHLKKYKELFKIILWNKGFDDASIEE